MRIVLISALLAACTGVNDPVGDTGTIDDTVADEDKDGFTRDVDCDDADFAVNPGAPELCDGIDNNCDDIVDEGATTTYYPDGDGDGYGDARGGVAACEAPAGFTLDGSDCDDDDENNSPEGIEVCDDADNNCDGAVDEGLRTIFYPDVDEDTFGDGGAGISACTQPTGTVLNGDDCADDSAISYPGADEICDELDNDCDETIDEGVTTTFYQDGDLDGYGRADVTEEACEPALGYTALPGDCDDANSVINPTSIELCDRVDNDCDGDIDEADAFDAETWYLDSDSDGFGDPAVTGVGCSAPSGFVGNDDDCDDSRDIVYLGADEICDELDNDCDETIDENDAIDAETWYLDSDGDGFGNASRTAIACDPPTSYVGNDDDCDDDSSLTYPDADEICDDEDNDCDSDLDEDAVDAETWYLDSDSDGFGDPDISTTDCDPPTGYQPDDRDCDDGDVDINPDADEVCDDADNDCDGDTDEDDAIDADTWYRDADEDGFGDPDNTTTACEQPDGYVDNTDDCDDGDPNDTDGDGLQDCEDDDIDGDGLRNEWDRDPFDDEDTATPTAGQGTDGDYTLTGTETQNDFTTLDGGASADDDVLTIDDPSIFSADDEILILSQQGDDAGFWQTAYIIDVDGSVLTIEPSLSEDLSSDSIVLVQRIPQYEDVTISSGGTLRASNWNGSGGGVVIFRATGTVTIEGTINATGRGFRGGEGVSGNGADPRQGESYLDRGSTGSSGTNEGGGGARAGRADNCDGGAGGGYGTRGDSGTNNFFSAVTSGGLTYGVANLSDWYLGSGGGGGSPDTESDGDNATNVTGDGGDGGGLIAIFAGDLVEVSGSVVANGQNGADANSGSGVNFGELGGGGAGSGGQILMSAPELDFTGGTVSAQGGNGGAADGEICGFAQGGDGGNGRIRLEVDTLSGSTSPTAGSTGSFPD
ncbi:MAG: putative metal-binding motif-containing protein [Myxococcota bacterium]